MNYSITRMVVAFFDIHACAHNHYEHISYTVKQKSLQKSKPTTLYTTKSVP